MSLLEFAFPLNVYAWLIEREEGKVDYLHYALFEQADESVASAQQRATDFLFAHLPPPCRMLDIGSGLGTTLRRLQEAGYQAWGITPDPAQVETICSRLGKQAPISCCRLEDFTDGAGSWQLLLFQESAQYLDGLDLFEAAYRLLDDAGEIVIMDEFSLRREEPEREGLPYLPHFLAWAERFGFTVHTRIDLTVKAAPTVDWLLRNLEKHAQALRQAFGLSEAQVAQLIASNRRYQARYRAGHYGYFLLRLQRIKRPRWRLGRINGPARVAQMRELFRVIFGQAMSEAHWQWKYGEGRGVGIGVWDENGALVAHYGAISRSALLRGQLCRAFCGVDFMVAPCARRALTRKGPAFLVAATLLEHEAGFGAPHLVALGFPNRRAFDLPQKLGLYQGVLTRMMEVGFVPLTLGPSLLEKVRRLDIMTPLGQKIASACWKAMRADLKAWNVLIRDGEWLAHRYGQCYDARSAQGYLCFVIKQRLTDRPLGLVVLRMVEDGRCELLDMIGALKCMPTLIKHARRLAANLGARELFFWASEEMLPLLQLPPETYIRDLDVLVPTNGWTAGPPVELLVGNWWLTGGDTDYH